MHPRFDGPFLAGDKVNVWARWKRFGDYENAKGIILYEERDKGSPLRYFYFRVRILRNGTIHDITARFSSLTMRSTDCHEIDVSEWG